MSQGHINQAPPQNHTTVVVAQAESTSGLAIAGLVFNILGWVTCGSLSLIGVPLSFLSLFARGPKGTAIAGLIVGFPGVIFFALIGASMLLGALGLGAAGAAVKAEMEAQQQRMSEQQKAIEAASQAAIDQEPVTEPSATADDSQTAERTAAEEPPPAVEKAAEADSKPEVEPKLDPPTTPTPEEKPAEEPTDPKKIPRTWKDAAGKFSTEATFNGIAGKTDVFLKKADGKVVKVPIEKLSDEDKAWLGENTGWKPE